MNTSEHLLSCLAEECCEVGQRVSKALRFGLAEVQRDQPLNNAERIEEELRDLIAVAQILQEENILPGMIIPTPSEREKKRAKIECYMLLAEQNGALKTALSRRPKMQITDAMVEAAQRFLFEHGVDIELAEPLLTAALSQGQDGATPITSAELLAKTGHDLSKPFERGEFPPEMRMMPARDGIEAQRGLNDVFPGDPVPAQEAGAEPVADLWQELLERDDRTSPEEYPDMCLITREELAEFILRVSPPHRGDWEKAVEAGVRAGIKALNDREPTRDHPTYQHAFVDAALRAAAPYMVPEEWSVERLAQWLHDEVEWPDPDFPHHSWPEHPDDTGQRDNGWLKIIPKDTQEQFRDIARRMLPAAAPYMVPEGWEAFQERVQPWMMACFGPEISADKMERCDRFIEEALELVQAGNYPKERALALVDYVYDRDQGDINQEVGGVMVTLAAHCLAHGIDMHAAGETELARVWTKIDKIRAKQAAKPTGSALPSATSPNQGGGDG